jgi:hypothetical protein
MDTQKQTGRDLHRARFLYLTFKSKEDEPGPINTEPLTLQWLTLGASHMNHLDAIHYANQALKTP